MDGDVIMKLSARARKLLGNLDDQLRHLQSIKDDMKKDKTLEGRRIILDYRQHKTLTQVYPNARPDEIDEYWKNHMGIPAETSRYQEYVDKMMAVIREIVNELQAEIKDLNEPIMLFNEASYPISTPSGVEAPLLHQALERGHIELIDILINEKNVDVTRAYKVSDFERASIETPLQMAINRVAQGHKERPIVDFILKVMPPSEMHKQLHSIVPPPGTFLATLKWSILSYSLVHMAIAANPESMWVLELLLSMGVNVNQTCQAQIDWRREEYRTATPIQLLVSQKLEASESCDRENLKGLLQKISLMIRHGADVLLETDLGKSVLDLIREQPPKHAAEIQKILVSELMWRVCRKKGIAYPEGILGRDADEARMLIERGYMCPDEVDIEGNTFLCNAVKFNRSALIELLVDEKKVDVNNIPRHGYTPLCIALMTENIGLANYLIDRGAKLDVINSKGETPESIAKAKGFVIEERVSGGKTKIRIATQQEIAQRVSYVSESVSRINEGTRPLLPEAISGRSKGLWLLIGIPLSLCGVAAGLTMIAFASKAGISPTITYAGIGITGIASVGAISMIACSVGNRMNHRRSAKRADSPETPPQSPGMDREQSSPNVSPRLGPVDLKRRSPESGKSQELTSR